MKRAAAFILLFFSIVQVSRAQWSVTAPHLIDMRGVEMAAMKFSGGHLWTGTFGLFESLDSGATWKKNTAFPLQDSDYILDISLFDTNNILVTGSFGIYTSTNGGQTWRTLLKMDDIQQATSGTFCGSPDTIAVIDFPGVAWQSTNAGATWHQTKLDSVAQKIMYHNGALYAMTGIGDPGGVPPSVPFTGGIVFKSTDGGTSWNPLSGVLDEDSYDMVHYPCQNALLATNEAWNNGLDSASQILISTDDGASWQVSTIADPTVIGGGLCATTQCVFATTTSGGVLRLTGSQWETISSDNVRMIRDTRSICAIDDNIILVIDEDGNIQRTTNSGGVPLPGKYQPPALLTTSLFQGKTLTPCEQLQQSVFIAGYSGVTCQPPHITSQRIQGPDAGAFTLDRTSDASLAALDSDLVTFHPGRAMRSYNDTLVIVLSDGTVWRVPLTATGIDSGLSVHLKMSSVKTDTIGDLDIPIMGRVTHALEAQIKFDTSQLVLKSVTDPLGEPITMETIGDRVKLHFTDVAGLGADTLLATLHFGFYPLSQGCTTLSIDSLAFNDTVICATLTGSEANICYTGSCATPLFSNFLRYNSPLKFSIIPNPAGSEAVLSGGDEHTTVSLFDAAGVLRRTVQSRKIDLGNLPQGVYLARVQSGEFQAAIRLVHMSN